VPQGCPGASGRLAAGVRAALTSPWGLVALLPLSRLPVTKQPSCRSGHLAAAASNGSRLAACQRWTPLARRGRSGEWAPGGAEGWGGAPERKMPFKIPIPSATAEGAAAHHPVSASARQAVTSGAVGECR
jgi:hypothetical protein